MTEQVAFCKTVIQPDGCGALVEVAPCPLINVGLPDLR